MPIEERAIPGGSAAANPEGAHLVDGAEITIIAKGALINRLRFAGGGKLVAHPNIALIVLGCAGGQTAATTYAKGAELAGGTECSVIASNPFVGRQRFAQIEKQVAYAHVALIVKRGAVGRPRFGSSRNPERIATAG